MLLGDIAERGRNGPDRGQQLGAVNARRLHAVLASEDLNRLGRGDRGQLLGVARADGEQSDGGPLGDDSDVDVGTESLDRVTGHPEGWSQRIRIDGAVRVDGQLATRGAHQARLMNSFSSSSTVRAPSASGFSRQFFMALCLGSWPLPRSQ